MGSRTSSAAVAAIRDGLNDLADVDVSLLPDQCVRDEVLILVHARRQLDAQIATRVAAVDARDLAPDDGCRDVKALLKAFARQAPAQTRTQLATGRLLRVLPQVTRVAATGQAPPEHLQLIQALVKDIGEPKAALLDQYLAMTVAECTATQVADACAELRALLTPDGAPPPDPHEERFLQLERRGDHVKVSGRLSPDTGAALITALDAIMRPPAPDDDRSFGQRRADALGDLATRALNSGTLPIVQGERPHLGILITPTALTTPPREPSTLQDKADAFLAWLNNHNPTTPHFPNTHTCPTPPPPASPATGPPPDGDDRPPSGEADHDPPPDSDGDPDPGARARPDRDQADPDHADADRADDDHRDSDAASCDCTDCGRADGGRDDSEFVRDTREESAVDTVDEPGEETALNESATDESTADESTADGTGLGDLRGYPTDTAASADVNAGDDADPPPLITTTGQLALPATTPNGRVPCPRCAAPITQTPDTAWLDWFGNVSPDLAKRIACDADVWRIVLDPDHRRPLDVGRAHRLAPAWMRKAILARDKHCRFPGCDSPGQWAEIHHTNHWIYGAKTAINELLTLCTFHHHRVHEGNWTLTYNGQTNTVTVKRPNGRPYELNAD